MASRVEVNTPDSAAEALATPPTDHGQAPRLAPGVELIGEFEDSGFHQAPYIARRADGQVVQMPELLFRLAEQIDGRAGPAEIAERFGAAVQRKIEPRDAQMLIDERLKPLGIVA
jgi:putative peptide zinc metalloprotease protein